MRTLHDPAPKEIDRLIKSGATMVERGSSEWNKRARAYAEHVSTPSFAFVNQYPATVFVASYPRLSSSFIIPF